MLTDQSKGFQRAGQRTAELWRQANRQAPGIAWGITRAIGRFLVWLGERIIIGGGVVLVVLFFLYTEAFEGEAERLEAWAMTHDTSLDLVTVWCFAAGFYVLTTVELGTWLTMWGTEDVTPVGKRLRSKKLGYALICAAMGTLYSFTLWGYYAGKMFTFWERFGVRILGIAGIVVAVTAGILFLVAFVQHKRRVARGDFDL
jgi:hypothetical protein